MISWVLSILIKSMIISLLISIVIYKGISIYKKNKGADFNHKVATFIFLYYMSCLVYITIYRDGLFVNDYRTVNFDILSILINSFQYLYTINIMEAYAFVVYNVVGNILWFVPFGFFVSYFLKKPTFIKICFMSFAFSLFIEVSQYILYVGISDIDDLIFNTFGGCIGYGIYYLSCERRKTNDN